MSLPPLCRAATSFALLPPSQTLRLEHIKNINFTLSTPFSLTLSPLEKRVIEQFDNDSLYQNILDFNSRPIPIQSLDSEIGSLRNIQAARKSAETWAHASSYLGISVSTFVFFSVCAVFICYRLLHENRDRHGREPDASGRFRRFINLVRPPRIPEPYRNQEMPLQAREAQVEYIET